MRLIMNPTRQRIIQAIALRGEASAGELVEELTDIPQATLYRHIRLLHEGGLLEIAGEERVRGATQRRYRLAQKPFRDETSPEVKAAFLSGLMSVYASFQRYFTAADNDPVADMLFLSASTLMLSDDEFKDFMAQLGELIAGRLANRPEPGRKPRRLTFISSPCEEERQT